MKYLFLIKYKDVLVPPKYNVGEKLNALHTDYIALETTYQDGSETGYVGIVELDNVAKTLMPGVGFEKTAAEQFFEGVRVITASLNGYGESEAINPVVEESNPPRREPFPPEGAPGPAGPQLATWSRISLDELIECFTYIGTPTLQSDINDYAIVPPEMIGLLKGVEALYQHMQIFAENLVPLSKREAKIGLLGGIGGLGGEP